MVFPTPWKASAYEYEVTRNRLAHYQTLSVDQGDRPRQLIGYAGTWTDMASYLPEGWQSDPVRRRSAI